MSAAPDSSPCSIHETVQSAFAVNDLAVLQDCCADLLMHDAVKTNKSEI